MKKKSALLAVLMAVAMTVLTACGSKVSDEKWNQLSEKITKLSDIYDQSVELIKENYGEDSEEYKAVTSEESKKQMEDFKALKKEDFKDDAEVDASIQILDQAISSCEQSLQGAEQPAVVFD